MARLRILHLVGSPTSDFFLDLSLVYARGCIAALRDDDLYAFVIALVMPDGMWRFPAELHPASIAAAPPMALPAALAMLETARIDIALPQMFCPAGMTDYRALLDAMGIAYIGNRPLQMAVTADKAMARAIVAAAGVRVPPGELLRPGDRPTLPPPVVVKPNAADNSDGVSLVASPEAFAAALADAFAHSDAVLVERYIPLGREVRCGIVERGDDLVCLPLEEYFVDQASRPVRTRGDKLRPDPGGGLALAAKQAGQSWIVAADDPIVDAVQSAARTCHRALSCRHYSLFDFRIDPDGVPWFLEAGLYCSFSPQSVIVTMAAAAGWPLDAFFAQLLGELSPRSASRPA